MEKSEILLILNIAFWLLIFTKGLVRLKKEGTQFSAFQKRKPSWLTYFFLALLSSSIEDTILIKQIETLTTDAVFRFILNTLLIVSLTLSPHFILSLLKKLYYSLKSTNT